MVGKQVALAVTTDHETAAEFMTRLGIAEASSSTSGDARVLPVYYRAGDNKRERSWEHALSAFGEAPLPDFGVQGPRTAGWCLRFLRRQQQHPDDYHRAWMNRNKLSPHDWGVDAHRIALRAVALGGCSDQVDLTNLALAEHLLREAQLVEHHYRNIERDHEEKNRKERKGGAVGLPAQEVELFLGAEKGAVDCMISPDLTEFVSKALERDANVQKQSRKAREERALARK